MARMSLIRLTNFRIKESKSVRCSNASPTEVVGFVGISKIRCYEPPSTIIGGKVQTGLQEMPKVICKDRNVGTW